MQSLPEPGRQRPSPAVARHRILAAVALCVAALTAAAAESQAETPAATRPPDIIVLLADDLGYSDLGAYGGEIDTPRIDRLAAEGLRFSQFYVYPRCSPTRAALLTGRYPHAVGVGHLNRDWRQHGYRGFITPEVPTIAERLRTAGYRTYLAGKWHLSPLGRDHDPSRDPTARGFDRFWGTLRGSGSYYEPELSGDGPATGAADFYYTDAIGSKGAQWIREHARDHPEQPLFLYAAFTAPHWPLQAHATDITAFAPRYERGWEAIRRQRLDRLRRSGLVSEETLRHAAAAPMPSWQAEPRQHWQSLRMATYAAMVAAMDRAVGEIVDAVAATRDPRHTVIVFLSDNGASSEAFRGLIRLAPAFMPLAPANRAPGARFGNLPALDPGPAGTFQSYGPVWAEVSNTPFRGAKRETWEGGIAAPLIVRWPQRSAERSGEVVATPAHVIDLAPTLLAAAGIDTAPAPAVAGDDTTRPVDLLSQGAATPAPRTLFWEHEGNAAVRHGDWKLVRSWQRPWQLYDLGADRSETVDLAAAHPQRVADLAARWRRWAAAVGVGGWPWVVRPARHVTLVAWLLIAGAVLLAFCLALRRGST